jgi:hypothetical protein
LRPSVTLNNFTTSAAKETYRRSIDSSNLLASYQNNSNSDSYNINSNNNNSSHLFNNIDFFVQKNLNSIKHRSMGGAELVRMSNLIVEKNLVSLDFILSNSLYNYSIRWLVLRLKSFQ